ncbi:hypothetical protein DMA11_13820 [Marinilabiliaceae bacterium JC017]|nr:hypothetical protein DMA11_13820 [Marinilabiliaceae bacterium JC017]
MCLFLALFFFGIVSLMAQNQSGSLLETFDRYSPIGFRTQSQWDTIRSDSKDLRNVARLYEYQLDQGPVNYLIYPFWLGYEYRKLSGKINFKGINRMGYLGYILNPANGEAKTIYSWLADNVMDDPSFKKIPADLILFCRGKAETVAFLQSDSAQYHCIRQVFEKLNRERFNLRKADGVNIYFPDFTIEVTDQFKQFIDSMASFNQKLFEQEALKYKLSVTLPKAYDAISAQLSGMLSGVDEFYFADYDQYGLNAGSAEIPPLSLIDSLTFQQAYDRYFPFHYQTPTDWDVIRRKFSDGEDEVANYQSSFKNGNHKYMIYPYWMGTAYQKVTGQPAGNIQRLGYMGYVLNPLTGYPYLTNSWEDHNILDDDDFKDIPADLLVFCRGSEATDIFLKSDSSQLYCIETLFEQMNRNRYSVKLEGNRELRNPDGLNLFFPDYSFIEKRALVQFVKSISLVNNSLSGKKDGGYHLYLTFPESAKNKTPFLSCLLQFADSIYFADNNQFGIDETSIEVFSSATDSTMLLQKISNQFLMYRFSLSKYDGNKATSIAAIIERGNVHDAWEYYFFVILFLVFVLLIMPVAYFVFCPFQILVQKYSIGVFVSILMILFEIVILTLFMIEEMSQEPVFFNTSIYSNFYLLLLPVVMAGIYPVLKLFQRQVVVP